MDFDKSYKQFSKTLKIARRVSVFGAYRKSTGFQMTFASILFARMCVIAQSIQRLTQQDVPIKYVLENWDYASTFGLTVTTASNETPFSLLISLKQLL